MTIEPVREGSRLSCSTMRASGCGMPQRIPRFFWFTKTPSAGASWFETRGGAALLTMRN